MLLDKLLAAGVGDRPLVFVTHRFVYSQIFHCDVYANYMFSFST